MKTRAAVSEWAFASSLRTEQHSLSSCRTVRGARGQNGKTPGFVYWADFLDLAGKGPVPWRKEIRDGISNSSKFLAFIDESFLSNYNCIMVRTNPILLL